MPRKERHDSHTAHTQRTHTNATMSRRKRGGGGDNGAQCRSLNPEKLRSSYSMLCVFSVFTMRSCALLLATHKVHAVHKHTHTHPLKKTHIHTHDAGARKRTPRAKPADTSRKLHEREPLFGLNGWTNVIKYTNTLAPLTPWDTTRAHTHTA